MQKYVPDISLLGSLYTDRVPKVFAKVNSLPVPPPANEKWLLSGWTSLQWQFDGLPPPLSPNEKLPFQPEVQICSLTLNLPSKNFRFVV